MNSVGLAASEDRLEFFEYLFSLMIFIRTVPILLIALMTMSLVDCSQSLSSSPVGDKIPKDLFIFYGSGA